MTPPDDTQGAPAPAKDAAGTGAPKASPQAAPPVDMVALAGKWLEEIATAERDSQDFRTRAQKIVDIFTEQRKSATSASAGQRKFSILWANVSTLQPSVYARTPQPVVQRRFRDRDPVARQVSEIMERAITCSFDFGAVDLALRAVRDDFLLVARGSAWVRYEPTFGTDPQTGEEILTDEKTVADFVHWKDLILPKARTWPELPWLARRAFMTREQLVSRFGKDIAAKVKLDHKPEGASDDDGDKGKKATVYEIWSKTDKKCIWVSPGCREVLDYADPHLTLADFFPCPRPAFGTLATDSLIPIPDYVFYQDQAEEIDDLTDRIAKLTDSVKLVGFYPAGPTGEGSSAIEIAAKPGTENVLVPVSNWAMFAEKGGSAAIQWWPVEQAAKVLESCFQARKLLIEDIYQITGISDIVRGDTDPRETKGAQQIKAQWGSIRLRDRQQELARFARDLTRIMGEVIADKFQPDTLSRMTGIQLPWQAELDQKYQQDLQAWSQQVAQIKMAAQQQAMAGPPAPVPGQPGPMGPDQGAPPPDAPAGPPKPPELPPQPQPDTTTVTMDAVIQLMRDDRMRSFRVDIETDSTVEADENEYKQRLSEFLTGISVYLEKVLPVGQSHPELVPFLGDVLTTIVRGFRVGRQLEGTIEEAVQSLTDKAQQAGQAGPRPDPKQQLEMAKGQAQIQTAQIKAGAEQARAEAEKQIAAMGLQHAQASHEIAMRELALKEQAAARAEIRAQQEHDRDMQLAGMKHQHEVNRMLLAQQAAAQSVLQPPVAPVQPSAGGDMPAVMPEAVPPQMPPVQGPF